jgi:hypothetical protein
LTCSFVGALLHALIALLSIDSTRLDVRDEIDGRAVVSLESRDKNLPVVLFVFVVVVVVSPARSTSPSPSSS